MTHHIHKFLLEMAAHNTIQCVKLDLRDPNIAYAWLPIIAPVQGTHMKILQFK